MPPAEAIQPRSTRDDASAIVRRLRDAGHVAYFAGGCVRDALLGLEPKDYDIATDAPPDRVRQVFSNTQAVGAAFGVILVRHGKSVVEVATFRTDGKYLDGRRPEGVTFTTAQEDAKRRDFTINGMFYDPIDEKVIDFVGGQQDLNDRTLRAIGEPNHRFEEDHLRLLRAIRFAARFELQIEPNTAEAICRHAEHLKRISPERIADELRLMLTLPMVRNLAWRFLWDLKLMTVILRQLPERPAGPPTMHRPLFPQVGDRHPLRFGWALAALVLCYRFAEEKQALLELLSPAEIRRSVNVCRASLKISNQEAEEMTQTLDVAHLLQDKPPSLAAVKRFMARENSAGSEWLLEGLARCGLHAKRILWLQEQLSGLEKMNYAPMPFITGDDLTAAGVTPGPIFKRILDDVYDAQLEDRVTTKEQALQLAMNLAKDGK